MDATRVPRRAAVLPLALALFATSLAAQWVTYPTVGLPKKADGSPHLKRTHPKSRRRTSQSCRHLDAGAESPVRSGRLP